MIQIKIAIQCDRKESSNRNLKSKKIYNLNQKFSKTLILIKEITMNQKMNFKTLKK